MLIRITAPAVSVACLVASPAMASFIGLAVEDITDNNDGLKEYAIFASFNDPSVEVSAVSSVNIVSTTNFFHSTYLGMKSALPWTTAENAASSNPDADSFVTIGYATGDNSPIELFPFSDVEGFLNGNTLGPEVGWGNFDFSVDIHPDSEGKVLLAVFTPLNDITGAAGVVSGSMKIGYSVPGQGVFLAEGFFTTAPGPAGLALLALAALPRRRHRQL